MLFYYIRHGDPVYSPDSLTPLGVQQAEALAKRLALYGVDKIYSSTSERAKMTARPTCEILTKEMELLDWTNEKYPWNRMTVAKDNTNEKTWLFNDPYTVELFSSKEIRDLGDHWYDHPAFGKYEYEKEITRTYNEADAFFASLGYEHIRHTGKYKVKQSNDQRVALFAHQGFGMSFLSCVLDIPYPMFSTHFDMCHSGMTVIEFKEAGGYCVPKVLSLSLDSHLYREGLPTHYNRQVHF